MFGLTTMKRLRKLEHWHELILNTEIEKSQGIIDELTATVINLERAKDRTIETNEGLAAESLAMLAKLRTYEKPKKQADSYSGKSQTDWTRMQLIRGAEISTADEIAKAGGWRLAAIIWQLKEYNWPINTRYENQVAYYSLGECDTAKLKGVK